MMHKDAIMDELRQIELDVVEGEKQLADIEALLIELKRLNEDTTRVQAEVDLMRKIQLERDQSRQRLLSLLHPLGHDEIARFLNTNLNEEGGQHQAQHGGAAQGRQAKASNAA
ncbi:hypothetical protein [Bradyrhizobium sp. th.b2]|uniref:hypothetical protein n=1 Tax=Bradyrhizobium sp. th-b2 TaxID=172088 RepID=UPI001FD8A8DF|nr:hypothetical protein [Bradyrhizobium sp. th.b2]